MTAASHGTVSKKPVVEMIGQKTTFLIGFPVCHGTDAEARVRKFARAVVAALGDRSASGGPGGL